MHDFWQGVVVVVQRNPIIFQDIYCCSYSKEGTFVSSFTLCSRNSVFLRHDSIFEIHRNIHIFSEFPFFLWLAVLKRDKYHLITFGSFHGVYLHFSRNFVGCLTFMVAHTLSSVGGFLRVHLF